MTTLSPAPELVGRYHEIRGLLNTYGPASLADFRASAFDRFVAAGLPTTKDEEFKYLPLHPLSENRFAPAYGATINANEIDLPYGNQDFILLTFVNGELAPELSNTSGLPDGTLVMGLQEALEQHEELVMRHVTKVATHEGKLGSTNDERFTWLNDAHLSEGAFVFVPKGVAVERPVHIRFLYRADHGSFATHPRILIVLEEGAVAKVVETHQALGCDVPTFTNTVSEVVVGKAANFEHVKVQDESPKAVHVAGVYVLQEGDSVFATTQVGYGGAIGRTDLNVFIDGEHAETWLNGAYVGLNGQIVDNHTRIDHAKPNCHSFEVYKGILGNQATGVFNGKIFVYEDAQKTDAKQTNKALLLSPDATFNTKPQLEIFADDVKCTHGATVGQIEDEALFYLRSRGIPESEARRLLVYAFVAEVLDRVSIESVREDLESALYAKLEA